MKTFTVFLVSVIVIVITLIDSSYELAINSVESKKKERLENAKKVYLELIETYPETKYIEQSIKLNDVLEKEITTFAKN